MRLKGTTYMGWRDEACDDAGRKGRGEKGRGKKGCCLPRGPT